MAVTHQVKASIIHGRRLLTTGGVPPSEKTLVEDALKKVASCCARAQLWLNKHKEGEAKDKALVRKWFGNDSMGACTRLEGRYKTMVSVYSRKIHVWRFTGNMGNALVPVPQQEDADFYAQVISSAGTQFSNKSVDIEFADQFFAAQGLADTQRTRLTDAKVRTGTIIHETSHRVWVVQGKGMSAMLSDDFAYDYTDCRTLAKHKAHYARANADSIMYFALEFFDTRAPTVPDRHLSVCRYLKNPTSAGLPAGDMDELNNNTPVTVDKIPGD